MSLDLDALDAETLARSGRDCAEALEREYRAVSERISAYARGEAPLDPKAARTLLSARQAAAPADALSERERRVLELRYGLDGQQPRTLDEVGRAFNVTRERIRQIENHTLKKLEALPEAQRLRDAS